jgi:CRT-like, chloroquine-resistance transporter-like
MAFSLLMLRNRGCEECVAVKNILDASSVRYDEELQAVECGGDGGCNCVVLINGEERGNAASVKRDKGGLLFDGALSYDPDAHVIVETSATPWSAHLRTYYTVFQYIGAAIILTGLIVSVWPALAGTDSAGAGPPLWDLIFFSANIPTALSGVYKEIAFGSVDDMDVWWLNGWVSLWQFLIGLTYAPLAAVMSDLPINEIPSNIWDGLRCVLLGANFISPPAGTDCTYPVPKNSSSATATDATDTSAMSTLFGGVPMSASHHHSASSAMTQPTASFLFASIIADNSTSSHNNNGTSDSCACTNLQCGGDGTQCCDSCNGRYDAVSELPAWLATLLYMCFNVMYNVFLLLVIKYGSAALMYIASTVVLPLGSLSFTIKAFMGPHAQQFTAYDGAGLGVVLFGLFIYRFIGKRKRPTTQADLAGAALGTVNLTLHEVPVETVMPAPRTAREVRSRYYASLGLQQRQRPSDVVLDF